MLSKIFHNLLFCSVVGEKVPHFGAVRLVLGRLSLRPLALFPLFLCASCLRVFRVQLHLHISKKKFISAEMYKLGIFEKLLLPTFMENKISSPPIPYTKSSNTAYNIQNKNG
jgi:hypothetical protein